MNQPQLTALAGKRWGVFSRDQALAAGMSERQILWRVKNGDWNQVLPGVYRYAVVLVVTEKWKQRAMAGLLWRPDAVLSYQTAGAAWGLPRMEPDDIDLTLAGKVRSPAPWLRVHCAALPRCDRARKEPLALTSLPRVLLDLATILDAGPLEAALDSALLTGNTSLAHIEWRLNQIVGNGRRGVGILRELVAERRGNTRSLASELEALIERRFRRAGLPLPVPQFVIEHNGRFLAQVDFAYPQAMIAIEGDSVEFHAGTLPWEEDLERQNALSALGWTVLRVTWRQVRDDPESVVELVRRTLALRGQLR